MVVLEGTAVLAGLNSSPLHCSPVANSSPSLPHRQELQGPLKVRWSQTVHLPPWPLLGLGPSLGSEEKGLATGGQRQSRGEQCAGPGPAPEFHVLGPLHEGRGQDQTASALARPSNSRLDLFLCLGASPNRRPSSLLPRAHAKVQAHKGSARRESKEESCPHGGGGPFSETRP